MTDSFGTLAVRAYAADAALPVSGATVRIFGAEDRNREVVHSLITDRDGVTERVTLPTPEAELSLSSSPTGLPYSLYDIEVDAEGFYPKRILGIAVFSGVDSILPVNLIPADGNTADYPRGNVNAIIPQNTDLE